MKNKIPFVRFFSSVLAVSLLLSGCGLIPVDKAGEMRQETHSVDADTSTAVKVVIEMDLGELDISSSSNNKLMEGTFQYNVTEWKPQVVYEVNGSQGTLHINQPDERSSVLVSNGENHWDLRLGESVPMGLDIKVGAGESKLDLTKIDLTDLTVDTGAGTLDLDLRGNWTHDINIAIHGGIGDVTLRLPAEIGARVEVKNGLGSVNRNGLDRDGNAYVNGSYGKSPYTLFIRIDNGTGSVNLDA